MKKQSIKQLAAMNMHYARYSLDYFFDSIGDIAKQYGFTQSKVKNMLYHTRNKLKEYLIKEGIEV